MPHGPKYTLAENPCIDVLVVLGYRFLPSGESDPMRDGPN
jgi:hypothetical protein